VDGALQAILRALHIVRTQTWFSRCRVWLYRGAWQVCMASLSLRKPARSSWLQALRVVFAQPRLAAPRRLAGEHGQPFSIVHRHLGLVELRSHVWSYCRA